MANAARMYLMVSTSREPYGREPREGFLNGFLRLAAGAPCCPRELPASPSPCLRAVPANKVAVWQVEEKTIRDARKARALVRHVHRCVKTIIWLNENALKEGSFFNRSMDLTCEMLRAFDNLCRVRGACA